MVIVGAGECGAVAATHLREQGFDGSLTLIGEEHLHPYERPPLSKSSLASEAMPTPVKVLDEGRMDRLNIDFLSGTRATGIDRGARQVELDGYETVPYDRLLLTTGAQARKLPVDGGEHALTLRTFRDASALQQRCSNKPRVVIIGAGFIGLEVAASLNQRGCDVIVLEAAPRPLTRGVSPEHADLLAKRHLDAGVEIICDVEILRLTQERDGSLLVEMSGVHGTISAEVVLAGVGVVPNTGLAAQSGLKIDDGIAVDERLQTNDPAIFAAGDCCSAIHPGFGGRRIRLESWRNTHEQAAVAAENILDGRAVNNAVPWFWSDQYELTLLVAGLPHLAAAQIVRERPAGQSICFGLDAMGRLVSASSVARGTLQAKNIRVAEMMIAAALHPDPADLADPDIALRSLLRVGQQQEGFGPRKSS